MAQDLERQAERTRQVLLRIFLARQDFHELRPVGDELLHATTLDVGGHRLQAKHGVCQNIARRLAQRVPREREPVLWATVVSGQRNEHAALLSRVELFSGLDRVALAKLAAHLEPLPVSAGEALFNAGDAPDGPYLVSRGQFGVFGSADGSSDEVRFSTSLPGEIALLTGARRTATVRADQDGEVLRLDQARFLQLVRSDPSVGLAISAGLIRRLRAADASRLGIDHVDGFETPRKMASKTEGTHGWRVGRQGVALGVSAILLIVGWITPAPGDLGTAGWHALVSLVALMPILALEALPDGAVALLLVAIWVLGGVAPTHIALGGFATSTWMLCVSVFAVGGAIAASGLLYRLSLWAVARAGSFVSQWSVVSDRCSIRGMVSFGGGGGADISSPTGIIAVVVVAVIGIAAWWFFSR